MQFYKYEPIQDSKELLTSVLDDTAQTVLIEKLLDQHVLVEEIPPIRGFTEWSCGCYYGHEDSYICNTHTLLFILEVEHDMPDGISEENKNIEKYHSVIRDLEYQFMFNNYTPSQVYADEHMWALEDIDINDYIDDLEEDEDEVEGDEPIDRTPIFNMCFKTITCILNEGHEGDCKGFHNVSTFAD